MPSPSSTSRTTGPLTSASRQVRKTLINSVLGWESRRRESRPALDRLYLLDRHTPGADRDSDARLDEATLLLEFLLFEGRRADLQPLFQQTGSPRPVSAAFGIRLLERSPALLARIAAARFGQGWLPYLAGDYPLGRPPRRLLEALAPIRPLLSRARQQEPMENDPLDACWQRGLEALTEDLLALPNRESADWPERRPGRTFGRRRRRLALELAALGSELIAEVTERTRTPRHSPRTRPSAQPSTRICTTSANRSPWRKLNGSWTEPWRTWSRPCPSRPGSALPAGGRERGSGQAAPQPAARPGRGLDRPPGPGDLALLDLARGPARARARPLRPRLLASLPPPDPSADLPARLFEALQWAAHPAPWPWDYGFWPGWAWGS